MKDNGSYCPLIFNEIYADSSGEYRLCCHARSTETSKKYKSQTHKPFEYFNSPEMENKRDEVLSGTKLPECVTCYKQEEVNPDGESYRQRKVRQYQYDMPTHVDKVNLKLRINGTYCNLSCYMCIPYNSSTRRNEMNLIYPEGWDFFSSSKFESVKHKEYDMIVQDIIDNIEKVNKIHITGGEPLQLPKHWELIERIPAEHAKNIELVYDTNLTELKYKNHSVFEIEDKFKSVIWGVSCDHYQDKLSWIRYPIQVNQFEKNLREMIDNGFRIDLNCTISILNIHDLLDMYKYYKSNFGLEMNFNSIVSTPDFLSIKHLPKKIKDGLLKYYKISIRDKRGIDRFQLVKTHLKQDGDETQLDKAYDYVEKLSANRNFDWKKLWPDFLK
jgi:organic radical activating enzyme|tara:strand:- start:23 stop:1180 length:1158 start_codon:yes stop_codon:yes gene_type:complete